MWSCALKAIEVHDQVNIGNSIGYVQSVTNQNFFVVGKIYDFSGRSQQYWMMIFTHQTRMEWSEGVWIVDIHTHEEFLDIPYSKIDVINHTLLT